MCALNSVLSSQTEAVRCRMSHTLAYMNYKALHVVVI